MNQLCRKINKSGDITILRQKTNQSPPNSPQTVHPNIDNFFVDIFRLSHLTLSHFNNTVSLSLRNSPLLKTDLRTPIRT